MTAPAHNANDTIRNAAAEHLYVHVPFCARRCSYCDFAIAVRRAVPVRDYIAGVERELDARAVRGGNLATLYFGGGTPSKLGADGIERLAGVVRERFQFAPDAEITLEANPEDVDAATVAAWCAAGVTRVSLGVQSFDAAVLDWMHRTHSAAQARAAACIARDAGMRVSLDLIFAVPGSLTRDWTRDLDEALSLAPDHMSVYGLTVEHGTPLGKWTARGDVAEAPEELWAREFMLAHDTLGAAGFAHYEVSNYARAGHRARHNEAYWRDRAFLGVGPSAHGFSGNTRRWNEREYAAWLDRVQRGVDPVAGMETLVPSQRMAEQVYLGLRTDRGIALRSDEIPLVQPWVRAGWAMLQDGHESRSLVLTATGWMRLDALATALTSFRSRY